GLVAKVMGSAARNRRRTATLTDITMTPASPRRPTLSASFHDASAREAYGHHFRPIGIQAVAAGTRQPVRELPLRSEERRDDRPAVLRNGFDD
ncbi:MAG: hypothetical protein ACK4VM_16525, partial [Bosea sp. (in: a-proteobacteria)]